MTSDDALLAQAKRLLDEFAQRTPSERFAYWVRLGLIDADGQLTRRYGGSAEADPDSLDTVASTLSDPYDRLVWLLRDMNDTICLDGPTATRLLGESSIEQLADLLNEAAGERGLIERWTTAEGSPPRVDATLHRNAAIGARLTESGRARARQLEALFDRDLPLEGLTRH